MTGETVNYQAYPRVVGGVQALGLDGVPRQHRRQLLVERLEGLRRAHPAPQYGARLRPLPVQLLIRLRVRRDGAACSVGCRVLQRHPCRVTPTSWLSYCVEHQ